MMSHYCLYYDFDVGTHVVYETEFTSLIRWGSGINVHMSIENKRTGEGIRFKIQRLQFGKWKYCEFNDPVL